MDSDSEVLEAIGHHLTARSRMLRAVTGANPPTVAEWDAHNAEGDRLAAEIQRRQNAAAARRGGGIGRLGTIGSRWADGARRMRRAFWCGWSLGLWLPRLRWRRG